MKTDNFAILLCDRNGSVYLHNSGNGGNTLFYCEENNYREMLAGMGFEPLDYVTLLEGTLANTVVSVKTVEIVTVEVLPADILRMSLQDALNLIGNGRIRDVLSIAALLKAERFKLIKRKIEVLYQDEYCIAVNKPHGLLVHRTNMSADKDFLLQQVRDQSGKKVYPAHRLDRPTSGVVLFAFGKETVREFFRVFRERGIGKTYLALVRGWTDDEGIIDSPLKTDAGNEQEALTLYKTLARTEINIPVGPYQTARYSLVEIDLKTGRTHQIRRHFAHLRHPLIGDTTYGDGRHNQMFRKEFNSHRLMLAAVKLELVHPFTGKNLIIKAPLEAGFRTVLKKINLNNHNKYFQEF